MLTPQDIRTVAQDARLAPPVVSLYLKTDRATDDDARVLASLRQLARTADRQLRTRLTNHARPRARLHERVIPRLLAFLDEEVFPAVRAVACFASVAEPPPRRHAPFIAFTLPRPVRPQVFTDPRPVTRPLLFLLDQYERYIVGHVLRATVRLFVVTLGEIEQVVEIRGDASRSAERAAARSARTLAALATRLGVRRILLAGDADLTGRLAAALPATMRDRVVGSFPAGAHARRHDILEGSLRIAAEVERAEEERAVAALRDALVPPARAVSGLGKTLAAVATRRAGTLVVCQGAAAPGALCGNCGALSLPAATCATCRARMERTEDVIAHAVERAAHDGARVEFVSDNMDLDALGGIGALLRSEE